ncbi:unnamed protein product [Cercopithifilaria johnstoni]|uniref:Uncharacterized protein n=1 Tax=Cercopithifilaria johnstoni TaxID=2874296 RepID=A0A8J2PYV8_9BILA|nr:unnamed protein product [Cercopithifilaria johnstoni]
MERLRRITACFKCFRIGQITNFSHFWNLELIGIQEQSNACDAEKALQQFKQSITKVKQRYQADPQLLNRYNRIIKEQLNSNIIEKVSSNMNQIGTIHHLI